MEEPKKIEIPTAALFPPSPPDYIFKNRYERDRPSASVARHYTTYLFNLDTPVDYIDGKGIFSYYQGIDIPRHGFNFDQGVYCINSAKRIITNFLRFIHSKELLLPFFSLLLISKKKRVRLLTKTLESFNDIASMTVLPFFLKDGYYCPAAKEVRVFTKAFFESFGVKNKQAVEGGDIADKTGEILAMIFEFDDAYRFRLQDLMSETSKNSLLKNFQGEMERIFEMYLDRENTTHLLEDKIYGVKGKLKAVRKTLKVLWLIPSFRRAIQEGLQAVNFKNWQLDESDIFYTYLYEDYNIRGKSLEERVKEYQALYANDESLLPQRVQINLSTQ